MTFRKLVWAAALLVACVGDDSTTVDGGKDVTVDQSNGSDAASDAAYDAGPLGKYSTGDGHSCAVYSDGSVWCWGNNGSGQGGQTPTQVPQTPQKVPGLPPMKLVSAGGFFTCGIAAQTDTVWCWGKNDVGQLGHPPTQNNDIVCGSLACNPVPTQVPSILATNISTSNDFTCAITTNGTSTGVTCWGQAQAGQLEIADAGSAGYGPTAITGLPASPATIILAKFPGGTACIIDANEHLWCWGDNTWGQLGHTPGTLGDVQWEANHYACLTPHEVSYSPDGGGGFLSNVYGAHASLTTCAVIADSGTGTNGQVWCWGDNTTGNLGNGTADPGAAIVPHPQPTMVTGLSTAFDVKGGNSMCAVLVNGQVWCWGSQADVNATVGTGACSTYSDTATLNTCELTPVLVNGVTAGSLTADHVHVVAYDKNVKGLVAWGNNGNGELGHAVGTMGDVIDAGTVGIWQNPVPQPVQGLP